MFRHPAAAAVLFVLALTAQSLTAHAQDCPRIDAAPTGLVPVYEGACLIGAEDATFGTLAIPTGPAKKTDGVWRGETQVTPEGATFRRLYAAPADRSPLEVFRNYRDALGAAGFKILFECSGGACGTGQKMGRNVIWTTERRMKTLGDVSAYAFTGLKDDHYLAAQSGDGTVTLGLYIAQNDFNKFPETYQRAILHLDIVQSGAMENKMVDAAAMRSALDETGKIALDAIEFDFAKATLRPQSNATLDEMARLLTDNPDYKVYIVGHTDNVGGFESNLALSRARAEAVVAALITRKIDGDRVVPAGVADLSPVASNATEAGRARNRRVEMVKR